MDIKKIESEMEKVIEFLKHELGKVRTGRANPAMLDEVKVEAYGSLTPLNQVAMISVPEARQLLVKPYDPSTIKDVEDAINKANLGLNPSSDSEVIRINIPALTEESRKELTKVTKEKSENAKVGIRNIRKDANNEIKKSKELTKDEIKVFEENIQTLTDKFNKIIEAELVAKNEEIMKI